MMKKTMTAMALVSTIALGFAATQAEAADIGANTTIGGKMYFDFSNINQKADGVDTTAKGTNFDVKRFYLTAAHTFDDIWSANLTTDFNYVSNDQQTQLYVKKAYLEAKLDKAFVARIGSADLPWVPFVEDIYGFRYVENIMIDRTKYGTSADWGLHVSGKFADGMVGYAVSAVNGAGYKKLTRSKSVDFEGRINFNPIKEVTLAVGGYTGKLGQDIQGANGAPSPAVHTAQRVTALAAYTNKQFRIGAEYFHAKNWSNVTTVGTDSSDGYSAFGSFNVTPQVAVFARYDHVKPKKDTNSALKDNYYNVGVSYSPRKDIDLALVYKRDKAQNGTISTSNGTIGGVNDGTYDEIGLWGQFKF
jgi:hypothetical protein